MNWKVVVGGTGVVLFLGVCIYMGGRLVDDPVSKEGGEQSSVSSGSSKTAPSIAKVRKSKTSLAGMQKSVKTSGLQKRPTINVSTNSVIPAAEKKMLDDLQLALDEEDINKLRLAVPLLAKSASPDVRSKVVESLRWFKQKALPELRSMLTDPDPDVAREASDGWQDAVEEIADETIKGKELVDGMLKMTDVDMLRESIMGFYEMDDGVALGYVMQLITSGNPAAAAVAREGYEHIAGDPYSTPEAGQRFIEEWRKNNPVEGSAP
jgi:hypothetical protein